MNWTFFIAQFAVLIPVVLLLQPAHEHGLANEETLDFQNGKDAFFTHTNYTKVSKSIKQYSRQNLESKFNIKKPDHDVAGVELIGVQNGRKGTSEIGIPHHREKRFFGAIAAFVGIAYYGYSRYFCSPHCLIKQ